MSIRTLHFTVALTLFAPVSAAAQAVSDSGTFAILHSGDTVATEQFSRTATRLLATLAIRNAKATSQRWEAVLAPDGTVPLIQVTVREGKDSGERAARVVQRARVIFKEDSVAVDEVGGTGLQTRLFATERGAMPYLNLSFALLEQTVRRTRATSSAGQVALFNLGGGQTLIARLSPLGTDSLALDIGPVQLRLRVDSIGRLLGAWIPAQRVIVERR